MGNLFGIWLILFVGLVAAYLTATKTDFTDYIFVPWPRRRAAYWRHPWWRRGREAELVWLPPRYQYIRYAEPFVGTGASGEAAQMERYMKLVEKKEGFSNNIGYPDLYNDKPYHLLDLESKGPPEKISNMTSRSCFAGNFERLLEQTGNFRQATNNFQHGYPDSCSAPYQELNLAFYKSKPTVIPPMNCL
jgi:hypothetical protein